MRASIETACAIGMTSPIARDVVPSVMLRAEPNRRSMPPSSQHSTFPVLRIVVSTLPSTQGTFQGGSLRPLRRTPIRSRWIASRGRERMSTDRVRRG